MYFSVFLALSLSVVYGRVLHPGPRSMKRADDVAQSQSSVTRIGIEVAEGQLNKVFLLGGFTNGDLSTCSDTAGPDDPCSIPITHNLENRTSPYVDWAAGDNYLDFYGAEVGQGSFNEEVPLGTPTSELQGKDSLPLLNSNHRSSKRLDRYFYYVELQMDCSKTGDIFEIEVVTGESSDSQRSPGNNRRGSMNRDTSGGASVRTPHRINFPSDFDFTKLDEQVESSRAGRRMPNPSVFNFTLHPDLEAGANVPPQRFSARDDVKAMKPPRAMGWKANMDTASGPDARPFEVIPQRVESPRRGRLPAGTSCFGTVAFSAPYTPKSGRFIGKCGFANIFAYTQTYCEVNPIPGVVNPGAQAP